MIPFRKDWRRGECEMEDRYYSRVIITELFKAIVDQVSHYHGVGNSQTSDPNEVKDYSKADLDYFLDACSDYIQMRYEDQLKEPYFQKAKEGLELLKERVHYTVTNSGVTKNKQKRNK